MNNKNDDLDLIKRTIGDTKYILDDATPYYGISKVLSKWLLFFSGSNIILCIYRNLSVYFNFFGTDLYYSIYRIVNIVLFILSFIIYLILINKTSMTLKEKDFLKGFSIYPLLFAIFKTLYSISYYINIDIMILLYDTIPFDLIITFIAIYQLYLYLKNKKFLYLSLLSILCILMFSIIKYLAFNTVNLNIYIVNLNNLIDTMNLYSIFIIFLFGISIVCMKDKKHE